MQVEIINKMGEVLTVSSKHAFEIRVWAVLHYLNERESNPPSRNTHQINCYLVGNWKQTKALLDDLEVKGYIEQDLELKIYQLTSSGREKLPVLRNAFRGLSDEKLDSFIKKARL
jgi:hypothetical protein